MPGSILGVTHHAALGLVVGAQGAWWNRIVDFSDYSALVPLVSNSLIVGAVLGITGGLLSTFVMMRDLPFAVHGISELSFAGAAAAVLAGVSISLGSIVGSLVAALLIGILGVRARDRNSIIGVLMPFGLGLGVLFLALHSGRSANRFGLLVGQIVAIDSPHLVVQLVTCAIVIVVLGVLWRPLSFASVDPEVAAAHGVPVGALSAVFMVLLGFVVALSVQVVGALLVLSILCTPAAAAMRVTSSPRAVPALSALFGFVAMTGGILLALGASVPISPYVTTISFVIYLGCRAIGRFRSRSRSATVDAADATRVNA